jgi:hypothetical protein
MAYIIQYITEVIRMYMTTPNRKKKLWTDMNPSNVRVLVWYNCKNGTEAWSLLKILFQLPSTTNLCYKMRWQQYEENITRGSLRYTILFIKHVTPECSTMNCRGCLGCRYQPHLLLKPNTLSTEPLSSQNHSLYHQTFL